MNASSGAFLASSAIRCSLVETLAGLGVPCIFPSSGSVARLPSPSTGSLGLVPPLHRYGEELRLPAVRPAALRCLRLAVPSGARYLLPPPTSASAVGQGFLPGCPSRSSSGDVRTSQVPGEPQCVCAVLFDPGGASAPGDKARRCCRRSENHGGPREQFHFEAQSHGSHAPCVRFAAGVTPKPRNTRFRLVASLCRAGLSRRVPM